MRNTVAAKGRHLLPHVKDRDCEEYDARRYHGSAQQLFIE